MLALDIRGWPGLAALGLLMLLVVAAQTTDVRAESAERAPTKQAADNTPSLKLPGIHLRDPFILPVPERGRYYLFGTGWSLGKGPGFVVYDSPDLKTWQGPKEAFRRPKGFWADRNYWAPEVHRYKGTFYMFASFKAEGVCRGTQILIADEPAGPYRLHSDGPVTPRDWECLDGTLYVDKRGAPWMVFCHEWVQVGDGEICAVRLSGDLKKAIGEPVLLFRASAAPWVLEWGKKPRGRVTDGPFLHRTADGTLIMLWSSFGRRGYALAVATSESGELKGPWRHPAEPLIAADGGHGMIFRTFGCKLMLSLHQPNRPPRERPRLFELTEQGGRLVLAK